MGEYIFMRMFNPLHRINGVKDDYNEPYLSVEEQDVLISEGIKCIYQIFQNNGRADPHARRVQKLLENVAIGQNSRTYRLEELRARCEIDPARFEPDPRRPGLSYTKTPNTWSPDGDGHLPRRARGVLTETAGNVFFEDATRAARELFDHHHRGGSYDKDDYGRWKFE